MSVPAALWATVCLLPFLLLRPLRRPSPERGPGLLPPAGSRHPEPERASVGRRGSLSARGKPSAPACGGRGAWEGKGAEAGPRLPPTPGGAQKAAVLKRQRRRRQHSGEGGESAGCLGTPPPSPAEGRRALGGGLGLGRGAGTRRAGGSDDPAPGFASSVTRPPRGPGPRLQRRASSHIPAHPRAPCIPARARAPGEGSARGAEEGAPQARSLGKSRPWPQPSLQACPKGTRAATPVSPPRWPPHRFPIVLSRSLSREGGGGTPLSS